MPKSARVALALFLAACAPSPVAPVVRDASATAVVSLATGCDLVTPGSTLGRGTIDLFQPSISPSACGATAVAFSGWTFSHWTGSALRFYTGGPSSNPVYLLQASTPTTLEAVFVAAPAGPTCRIWVEHTGGNDRVHWASTNAQPCTVTSTRPNWGTFVAVSGWKPALLKGVPAGVYIYSAARAGVVASIAVSAP